MDNQIVIHASSGKQKRIALVENGELAQFFIESPENRRSVGDIYLAQVHKVMSGIRASFIDLSTPKDGFLHYSDLGEHLEAYLVMLNGRDSVPKKASETLLEFRKKVADNSIKNMSPKEQTVYEQNLIGGLLKPGQKVMVQVVKEPIGSKGPRVSTDITLAGRFLVLIPFGDYVAVSKRIRSYKERRRLKGIISEMLPNGFGVIVRTVAEGQDDDALRQDMKELHDKWVSIQEKLKTGKPTALLHRDLDMTESLVRDLFSKNYSRILIDDTESYKTIKSYIGRVAPSMVKNVQQYKGREHVFDHMNISKDVNSIFSPRVKMPSGGYLIFEQTEAMYVVDVNSGRYAAKKAQEDNSLKTNLEAAREIAKQLRLRDIGGIIVVDFIDLQQDSNRKKVYDEIRKEFKKDRAKTNILPMSDFGLMQITRQRIRPSVVKSVSKVCPMCGGSGSIVSETTLLSDVEAWISKLRHNYSYRSVELYVNPFFHSVLCQGLISTRLKWMFKYMMRISIHQDDTISLNDFKATVGNSDFDICETVNQGNSIEDALRENEKNLAEMESGGKKNEEMLDYYKKNGNGRDSRSGRGQSADKKDDGDSGGRKRSAPVRISQQARSSNKIKSKYYKKPGDSGDGDTSENTSTKDSGTDETSSKPNAMEVAKAYARKVKEQEKQEDKQEQADDSRPEKSKTDQQAVASSGKASDQPEAKETGKEPTKTAEGESEKKIKGPKKVKGSPRPARKKAVAKPPKSKSPADSDKEESKPASDQEATASKAEASRDEAPSDKKTEDKTDSPSPDKSDQADKKQKPAAKKTGKSQKKAKGESSKSDKKSKPEPKKEEISEAKSEKLKQMDEVKAMLNEDLFRKPASKPASDEKSDSVVTKKVSRKTEGTESADASPSSEKAADDKKNQSTSEKESESARQS